MSGTSQVNAEPDPCLQIQVDLSAMVDAELDAASVRRVMVHFDACPACRAFFHGIRLQLQLHQHLGEILAAGGSAALRDEAPRNGKPSLIGSGLDDHALSNLVQAPLGDAAQELRSKLMANREQLARILYELGRNFVLMGVSPNFSRVVASEPVPIPEVCRRGQRLLDEVQRLANDGLPGEWVRAKDLFDNGRLTSPPENLNTGRRLLADSLMLRPDSHETRIMLGHAHHVAGDHDAARREFSLVLEQSQDKMTRAYALLHLGNVYLEEGQIAHSVPYFQELVELNVKEKPLFLYAAAFNLALAFAQLGQFADCRRWLETLRERFPHRRRAVADELHRCTTFRRKLNEQPAIANEFAVAFPDWFMETGGLSAPGNSE